MRHAMQSLLRNDRFLGLDCHNCCVRCFVCRFILCVCWRRRLELGDGAEESKADDSTVALAVLGAVENISEEDWVNVYVKLVANELDILQKLSAKFKDKDSQPSGRSATRSSYSSGGMQVGCGCWACLFFV